MDNLAVIAFTEQGCQLACEIAQGLVASGLTAHASVAGPERFAESCGIQPYQSLSAWTEDAFANADALLYVGAAGIAVRAIAPHVKDKFSDPAVASIDERAQFVVPLLSGHVGGANDLARAVADIAGATPVISTATDVNGLFAVDEWARSRGLVICERAVAKEISAALLRGEEVGFESDFPVEGELPEGVHAVGEGAPCAVGFHVTLDETSAPFARTLHLVPRIITVGAGCHRDLPVESLEACIVAALDEAHVSPRAVRMLTSIDVKSDEPAFYQLAEARGWDLYFYSADELNAVPGEFTGSEFVRKIVGTDNVCERAAVCAGATLVSGKRPSDGATAALAVDAFTVRF